MAKECYNIIIKCPWDDAEHVLQWEKNNLTKEQPNVKRGQLYFIYQAYMEKSLLNRQKDVK